MIYSLCLLWVENSENQTAVKVYFKHWEEHLGWQQQRVGDGYERLVKGEVSRYVAWYVLSNGNLTGLATSILNSCECQRAFCKAGLPDVSALCSTCFVA